MKKTLLTASVVAIATLAFSGCGAQPQIPMSCELGYSGDYKGDIDCRDLKSLDKFKGLTSVKGNLNLSGTYNNIDGLSNLEKVYGTFEMFSNETKNIDGLKNLKEIEGTFLLKSNSVENLDGLSNLKKVGGKFNVFGINLNSVKGLSNLTSVGDEISDNEKSFSIGSRNLNDLTGIGNLDIDGPFSLSFSQSGWFGSLNKAYAVRLDYNSQLCKTIRPFNSSLKKNYVNQFGYYTDYHDIYKYICETE